MYTAVFVDDREDEFITLNQIRREAEDILEIYECLPEPTITQTQKKISEQSPDILLLDYRLDEKPIKEEKIAEYKAGPLAQQFRDLAIDNYQIDVPIFAVSHEENIRAFLEPGKTAYDLFDRICLKNHFIDYPAKSVRQIISFIEAYKKIISLFDQENKLQKLLEISDEESGFINQNYFQEINKMRAPHLISIKFFNTFIDRYWLLLNEENLIALLGIHPSEKESEHFKKLLRIMNDNDIDYKGIFGNGFKRWWTNRVKKFFEEKCSSTLGNLTSSERVQKISECVGLDFKPSVSRWTKSSDSYVSFACSSCKNPTEVEYSVSAYDQIPHPVLGKNRICWSCIQTGEYEEQGLLVDDSDEFTAEKIRNGKIVFS